MAEVRRMVTKAEAAELTRREAEHHYAVRRRQLGVFNRVLDFFKGWKVKVAYVNLCSTN